MSRLDSDPQSYFHVEGEGPSLTVSLTETGQQFAGYKTNTAHARGSMLAGMLIRMIPQDRAAINPALVGVNEDFPFEPVMTDVAAAAQPPLDVATGERQQFMAGAQQVLGGNA